MFHRFMKALSVFSRLIITNTNDEQYFISPTYRLILYSWLKSEFKKKYYCMSRKQWPILYSLLLYRMGHYFLDRQYNILKTSLSHSGKCVQFIRVAGISGPSSTYPAHVMPVILLIMQLLQYALLSVHPTSPTT